MFVSACVCLCILTRTAVQRVQSYFDLLIHQPRIYMCDVIDVCVIVMDIYVCVN